MRLTFYVEHRCGHSAQIKLRVKLSELDKLRRMRAEPCAACQVARVREAEEREKALPPTRISWWHWPTAPEVSSVVRDKVRDLCRWAEERGQ